MSTEIDNDLKMMTPKVHPENKSLVLTPESKFEKWIKIIHQKAIDGYKVKLYSDIESTGLSYSKRGRAPYDEVMDKMSLLKDAEKWFLEIEAIKNKNFPINIKHPLCSSSNASKKDPSSFAVFVYGKEILEAAGFDFDEIIEELRTNYDMQYFDNKLIGGDFISLSTELTNNAKLEITGSITNAFNHLKNEAEFLSNKIDRMIEYAFVSCYENEDGEVFLLKDEDGELIYFHEFVYPTEDGTLKKEQIIEDMPLIPYIIHKTDFDFLKGGSEHPFLKITMDKQAPDSGVVLGNLMKVFDFEGSIEDKKKVSENIMMFFHNGNGFDVPFIDAEMDKFYEGKMLRDYVQTYDTLKISKEVIPSDVQKFISACQCNPVFGGKEEIKSMPDRFIKPTSKALDNVRNLASFLFYFDPQKPKNIYEKAQSVLFNKFKSYFESEDIDWKIYENMLEYSTQQNPDLNLIKGFPKVKKGMNPSFTGLVARYEKYLLGRSEYLIALNKVKAHKEIYENINNIKSHIENNKFLKDALYRLNNIDRTVHGARVDSQLFMEAFIVLENVFYLKPKIVKVKRSSEIKDLKIPEDIMKDLMKRINEGA